MEKEFKPIEPPGQKAIDFLEGIPPVKSSTRRRYEAEIKIFRDQHGGLDEIRLKLGFSRRKMCQLLLVDPSAWTRWARDESRVPPHIFRALEWYLALNQKALSHPEVALLLGARQRQGPGSDRIAVLEDQLTQLKGAAKRQSRMMTLVLFALLALVLGVVFQACR